VAEGGSIWIQRFKEARRRFITGAGRFGLDHDAKRRAAEARHQMTSAAEEISKTQVCCAGPNAPESLAK
jgi:hypothetical protein